MMWRILACAAIAGMIGCQRSPEVGSYQPPADRNNSGQAGGGGAVQQGEASFRSQIVADDIAPYVDLNAELTYKFWYITFKQDGALRFVSGSAELRLAGLPAGQAGEMRLEIYENGALKLKGAQQVTLRAGDNNVRFQLKNEGGGGGQGGGSTGGGGGQGGGSTGGGDNTGSVVITINVIDGGGGQGSGSTGGGGGQGSGSTGGGGQGSGSTGGGGGSNLNFRTDVAPIAQRGCDRCHGSRGVATEEFWKGQSGYTKEQIENTLTGKGRFMPEAGSPESQDFSADDRNTLLNWLRSVR